MPFFFTSIEVHTQIIETQRTDITDFEQLCKWSIAGVEINIVQRHTFLILSKKYSIRREVFTSNVKLIVKLDCILRNIY